MKESGRRVIETTPLKSNSSFDMAAYSGTKKKELVFEDLEKSINGDEFERGAAGLESIAANIIISRSPLRKDSKYCQGLRDRSPSDKSL